MTDTPKTRPLPEKDADEKAKTRKFTEHEDVGREKHAETSDDISEGMPEKDRETFKDETGTK
ncbi:MAG: hypothetical protein ACU0CC_16875 [Sagittula sp.]|jgi:hypothetical protein|uniref:hypothetical protein n=1 Tax=Rhodobacterales TaxID=204455 RepID=UPI000C2D3B69|nr:MULTISPECIES: hypothetical protein [unclassified Sagittula]AUC55107.1 hypothetical protein CDO87_18900 [Sagittula sp. P11]WHZ33490.1 hypothetical protein QNI11_12605 [Sagittula sp. MA-2]